MQGGLGTPSPRALPTQKERRGQSLPMSTLQTPGENQESVFLKQETKTYKTKGGGETVQKDPCTLVVLKNKDSTTDGRMVTPLSLSPLCSKLSLLSPGSNSTSSLRAVGSVSLALSVWRSHSGLQFSRSESVDKGGRGKRGGNQPTLRGLGGCSGSHGSPVTVCELGRRVAETHLAPRR